MVLIKIISIIAAQSIATYNCKYSYKFDKYITTFNSAEISQFGYGFNGLLTATTDYYYFTNQF